MFKVFASARKDLLTNFWDWDAEDIIHVEWNFSYKGKQSIQLNM